MKIWKALVIDGVISSLEETNDENDLKQFEARRRQKTSHKGLQTITHMLLAAETEKEARTKAYDRWAGVLSRGQNNFHAILTKTYF